VSASGLLRESTTEEEQLLDIVMEDYIARQSWPNYQYVEAVLYQRHGLEAQPILAGTPRVQVRGGIGSYGWLRTSSTMYDKPQQSDQIALSISGMARSRRGHPDVNRFVAMLGYLCERQRTFVPSPSAVQTIQVTSDEIRDALSLHQDGESVWSPSSENIVRIGHLIGEEPSTWNCAVEFSNDGFVVTLAPFIRPYHGVEDVTDYVERVVAEISPPQQNAERAYPSGLALPEAIDYLNAVWHVHAKAPLIRIRKAEVTARLAFECNSSDQFDAQLSGLCQLLDGLDLPNTPGRKLFDLDGYLEKRLDRGSYERVHEAIETLRALVTIRAWRQHAADDRKWREAARRVEVRLPASDWNETWRRVHLAAVNSLAAIREELGGLLDPTVSESGRPDERSAD
jgi:hypothetical protein